MSLNVAEQAATNGATTMYAQLEDRILNRDQLGASNVFYDLVRAERPLPEIISETIRIHAPYTHVPYHQRIDNDFMRFVNNDHCLLSARVSLRMPQLLPDTWRYLPMAQTIWYVPTGLDPWNQLLGKAPGHYWRRGHKVEAHEAIPKPSVHWEDQEPMYLDGPFEERLNHWLTLVQYGQVIESYRVFLGLFEEEEHRQQLMAHMVFAGLIDVQDRMLYNRSYTTGHKAHRARATFELGEAIGWDHAHHVLYAGVPDIAVGPRWHSLYEMACQIAWTQLAREDEKVASSLDPSPALSPERHLLANNLALTPDEANQLIHAITEAYEPAYIDAITSLLLAGKDPRSILDTIQVASAGVVLEVGHPENFSMPLHGYEYTNTLRWFFDTFDHSGRIRLLYVVGGFINQCARWVRDTPGNGAVDASPPQGATSLSHDGILRRLDEALMALKSAESVVWTQAYLDEGYDRKPLVQTLAMGAVKQGNDPHNQELGLCFLEDYLHSTAHNRDQLLLASAHLTAGHRKYGDSTEAFRRFTEALG